MEVEEFLAHYGVKGMKWGVVNEDKGSGQSGSTSTSKTSRTATKAAAGPSAAKPAKTPSKRTIARREKNAKVRDKQADFLQSRIDVIKARPARNKRDAKARDAIVRDLEKQRDKQIKDGTNIRNGKLSNRQKNLIVGASIAVGIVAAYGAYKYVDSGQFNVVKNKGKAWLTGKDFAWKKNPALSKIMDEDGIMRDVVQHINPNYGKYGTKMNCRRATFAYEMRRRGYDVKATLSNAATGQTAIGMENATNPDSNLSTSLIGTYKAVIKEAAAKEKDIMSPSPVTDLLTTATWGKNHIGIPKSPERMANFYEKVTQLGGAKKDHALTVSEKIFESLATQPANSRGELGVQWDLGGGHSMAYEIVKGRPVIFDGQSGKKYNTPDAFRKFAEHILDAGYTRLDNIQLNEDFLQRWVTNV